MHVEHGFDEVFEDSDSALHGWNQRSSSNMDLTALLIPRSLVRDTYLWQSSWIKVVLIWSIRKRMDSSCRHICHRLIVTLPDE